MKSMWTPLAAIFLPPAMKLGQGNIFRSVCPHSVHRGGGACVVAPGGVCMVALGGMHGCSGGGHVWLLPGGACVVAQGVCMVAPRGACVVAPGGHVWDTTRYRDTVNEQAVCILLECILVYDLFVQGWGGHGPLGTPPDPLLSEQNITQNDAKCNVLMLKQPDVPVVVAICTG